MDSARRSDVLRLQFDPNVSDGCQSSQHTEYNGDEQFLSPAQLAAGVRDGMTTFTEEISVLTKTIEEG